MAEFLKNCLRKRPLPNKSKCAFCPLTMESTIEARMHVRTQHHIILEDFKKGSRKRFKKLKDQDVLKEEAFSIALDCPICLVKTRTNTGYKAHLLNKHKIFLEIAIKAFTNINRKKGKARQNKDKEDALKKTNNCLKRRIKKKAIALENIKRQENDIVVDVSDIEDGEKTSQTRSGDAQENDEIIHIGENPLENQHESYNKENYGLINLEANVNVEEDLQENNNEENLLQNEQSEESSEDDDAQEMDGENEEESVEDGFPEMDDENREESHENEDDDVNERVGENEESCEEDDEGDENREESSENDDMNGMLGEDREVNSDDDSVYNMDVENRENQIEENNDESEDELIDGDYEIVEGNQEIPDFEPLKDPVDTDGDECNDPNPTPSPEPDPYWIK